MTDNTAAPTAAERRTALWVLLGLLAAMAVATIAIGTSIYHHERDQFEQRQATEPPAAPLKPGEKEKEKAKSLPMGEVAGALATHPLFLWGIVNTLMLGFGCLLFGSAYAADDVAAANPARPVPPLKLLIVGVGGLLGFTTTCFLGLGFAYRWWTELSGGGLKIWNELWPWGLVAAAFGGLVLTFLSLLAVKSEERHNPTLRRLLYGFNAFLVGFLLLSVLALANGLFLIYGSTQAIDWTASQMATLSPVTKKALAAGEKPTEVYVFLRGPDELSRDMETLLRNAQAHAPKLEWRVLYATSTRDADKIRDLMKKHELLFQEGMLVVQDPAGDNRHLFVKRLADGPDDLGLEDESRGMMPGEKPRANFRGEQALLSALRQLSEGKMKTAIYVTQDSGELKLADTPTASPQTRERQGARNMSLLKTKLEKAGYEVRPWDLAALDEKTRQPKPIPDDAAFVLVAGANESIAQKLGPLDAYMKRPDGKLLLFLEPTRDKEGRILPTGFENYLKKFGIQPGMNQVINPGLTAGGSPSTAVAAAVTGMDPRLEAAYEAQRVVGAIPFGEARSLQVGPADAFEAKPLLGTYPLVDPRRNFTGQWAETAPITDIESFIANLAKTQGDELNKKLMTPTLLLAATANDKPPPPTEAPRPGMPPKLQDGKPRLVVFGSVSPLLSQNLERSQAYFFFVSSSLSWLKDKNVEIDGAVQVKARQFYTVKVPPAEVRTIQWLPLAGLLALTILVGVGVSLLRRR